MHRGKRSCAYQFDLRLSLRHGFSRNPEGFKSSVCMSDGNLYAERLTPQCTRLTKHLLPMHTVEAADSSTPLRSAQNDSAHLTSDLEVTHDVVIDKEIE